jgi:hypothetical protein
MSSLATPEKGRAAVLEIRHWPNEFPDTPVCRIPEAGTVIANRFEIAVDEGVNALPVGIRRHSASQVNPKSPDFGFIGTRFHYTLPLLLNWNGKNIGVARAKFKWRSEL